MAPTSKLPESTESAPEKAISTPAAQDSDACRCSFTTESDLDLGNEDYPPERIKHDDHWDRLVECNVWDPNTSGWAWYNDWIERGSRNRTNAQLDQLETAQEWLQKLPLMRRDNILNSVPLSDPEEPSIPLFIGDNGDEYQIRLTIGCGPPLPQIWCPVVLGSTENCAKGYFELRARIPDSKGEKGAPSFKFPKYSACIGILQVRTLARSVFPGFGDGPLTETTDFAVIVDLHNDDMPLWIVAHRQQLLSRPKTGGDAGCPALLPIFDGSMTTSDHEPYDIACILPSIRQLANRKPDAEPPSYEESCDLIRKTRAMVDPICFVPHEAQIEKFLHGEEVPKPAPPKKSHLAEIRGGISKLWAFLKGNT